MKSTSASPLVLNLALILTVCCCPLLAVAQTDTWLGGSGNWNNGSMWSLGTPPSGSNSAAIDNGNGKASPVVVSDVEQCASLTIDSDDSVTMGNGALLMIYGPTISNAGTFLLSGTSGGVNLDFNGSVTLTGAGGLMLSNYNNNNVFGYGQPNNATLTNKTTIQGAGNIGGLTSGSSLINQGTINANQTTPLVVSVGSGAVTNTGTLEATNGATLQLDNGTFTNTSGTIHADSGSIVTLSDATINGGTLTTSGTGTIQANCCLSYSTLNGVTISSGSTFQLNNNNIGFLQGAITDNGSIQINGNSSSGTILDIIGAVTLAGTGSLTMSNNANNELMGYDQANGGQLTNQITIQGSGSISPNGAGSSFTNQGTVNANQTTPLIIGNGGDPVTNSGTFEATNGGTLILTGGNAFTNTGGTIHADTGSTVVLECATINNGTLSTAGSGTIQASSGCGTGVLNGITLSGTFVVPSGQSEFLAGTIVNDGIFELNSSAGANTFVDINGAVVLQGNGKVIMSNSTGNVIFGYAQQNGASLTNESTIEGAGSINVPSAGGSFLNQHVVYANQKFPLIINSGSGPFTNSGTLQVGKKSVMYVQGGGFTNFSGTSLTGGKYLVSGTLAIDNVNIETNDANITLAGAKAQIVNQTGGNGFANFTTNDKSGTLLLESGNSLTFSGTLTNTGKLTVAAKSTLKSSGGAYNQAGGTTTVDGTLTAPGGVSIQAGAVFGKGTISSTVVSSGSVTAGDSVKKAGLLSMSTYTQNSGGGLNIQIGGTTVGTQYSQLAVGNGVSLSGTLNIKLISRFVPAVGNTFTILTGSAITGQFATVNGLTINGNEHFQISYNPTNVTLTVVSGG